MPVPATSSPRRLRLLGSDNSQIFRLGGRLWETAGMETTAAPKLLPHLWKSTLLSGILSLALGILVYVLPEHSIVIAAALFGIYLLVTGAAQVFFAFALHVSAGGRVLSFVSGAASLVLAVLCFRHFGQGYAILLLGIVMLGSPLESIEVLTLVVAIWLIVIGVFEIVSSFGIRSASRRMEKALAGAPPPAA